ncbi:MAG: FHA domain-containing protein [Propionibacteriaceae bacterium]
MITCPAGHQTEDNQWCDTCGISLTAPASPEIATIVCPNCDSSCFAGALFCEACGYDWTTGALPRQHPDQGNSKILDLDTPINATAPTNLAVVPAEVTPAEVEISPEPVTTYSQNEDVMTVDNQLSAIEWVAEVWVDPQWHELQDASELLPSPGLPEIIALSKRQVLIGRMSVSQNIHPDIDCGTDTGVSRRNTLVSYDGQRWFVEDLGSANGTYLGNTANPLPQHPITSRQELSDDSRIYVGAWTRIVIRRATADERVTFSTSL